MKLRRSAILRAASRAACLVALAVTLTGCGPDHDQPLLPYVHSASLGSEGRLRTVPPTGSRHHAHLTPTAQARHLAAMPPAPSPHN